MTTTSVDRSWKLTIRPDDGDSWADIPMPSYYSGGNFRPEVIFVTLHLGAGGDVQSYVSVAGHKVKKNGQPGEQPAVLRGHETKPQWVADLVKAERARLNLTEEALTRPA